MSKLKNDITEDDHVQGDTNAPVTLVEYGDYQCPHCRVAHPLVKRLEHHFSEKLRFVFRNFPLTQIHPFAEPAAEVAEFANAQGKFWEMHHQLFENQDRLGEELFAELSSELGLDPEALVKALEDGTYISHIRADFTGGVRSGVNGTPTFFINGERHNGPADYDHLVKAIEAALAS
jgi:protein-disulfide isomerase